MEEVAVDKHETDIYFREDQLEDECRICKGINAASGPLISPCHCKGSVGFVHLFCLQKWLKSSCRLQCEICNFHYQTVYCRRHTLLESIRLWLHHPLRRQRFKTDLYCLILLTIILCLIISICAMKLEKIYRGERIGLDPDWTITVMSLFVTVMTACYVWAIIYLVLRQILPWYTWWKSTRRVQLELFDMSPQASSDPNNNLIRPTFITEPIQIVLR